MPVDNNLAEPDPEIEKLITIFQEEVDRKYNRLIGRLARKLTHPKREQETELGNLIVDIVDQLDMLDVTLIGSGSIRRTKLGPLVTLSDIKEVFPYDDVLYKLKVPGVQLTKIFAHIMRLENRIPGESCCFQVSKGIQAVYSDSQNQLESLSINGQPVQADAQYTICIEEYHYKNSLHSLGITIEDLTKLDNAKVISTPCQNVLEEYFSHHQNLNSQIEGRLIYKLSSAYGKS